MKRAALAMLDPSSLELLVEALVPLVAARLAAALTRSSTAVVYTTRKGQGPAGYPHRAWQRLAPSIPGAVRRGRWWVVSAEALEAWERAQTTTAQTTSSVPAPATSAVRLTTWSPEEAMASVGLRRSKGDENA
jgi:hypothetical protein